MNKLSGLAKLRKIDRAKRKYRNEMSSTSSTAPARVPSHQCTPESPFPIVNFVHKEDPDTEPKAVYLSLSSDLRILPVRPKQDPPSSLLSFRRPLLRFKLSRMQDIPEGMDLAQAPLQQIVASYVAPVMHGHGPAIRISEGDKTIQLVASDEEERDHWLSALVLRLAPLNVIRNRFKAEIRSTRSSSIGSVSVAEAAKEVVRLDEEAGNTSGSEDGHHVSLTKRLWTAVGTSAPFLNWTSSFGQAIAGSAKGVEKLTQPFCQIGVVGCAFSLISMSARTIHLLATERNGMEMLESARRTIRGTSLALCECLVQIFRTGFQDEELIGLVFDVIEESWDAAARVEEYVLMNWASRVWKADEVDEIEKQVAVVRRQVLSVGVMQFVSTEIDDVKKRMDDLEVECEAEDVFRSCFPDPVRFTAGLVPEAAKTTVDVLKNHAIFQNSVSNGAPDVASQDTSVARISLVSLTGEGGVGKTSACKLLCADSDVQNHFSGGAILWLALGPGISDDNVKKRISRAVGDCGGQRSSAKIRRADNVNIAVDYARHFFQGRRILLVIDNVWKPAKESDVADWMTTLSRIAPCPGSVVLMTTRCQDLCSPRDVKHVRLGRLQLEDEDGADWKIAEALYDEYLKEGCMDSRSEEQSQDYRNARKKALKISCGLPLAIASICGLIQLRENSTEAILALIARMEKDGGLAGISLGKEAAFVLGHRGLYAAMSESLEFLDKSERGDKIFMKPYGNNSASDRLFSANYLRFRRNPVSARYAALEAMDKSLGKFSFSILARLWHLKYVDDAEKLALRFANVHLGRIERSGQCNEEDIFILHDLQYDFCSGTARRLGVNGHHLLLSGCTPCLGKDQDWASFCFSRYARVGQDSRLDVPTDSFRLYMGRNLFRHLSRASLTADESKGWAIFKLMLDLLTDFWWVRGRSGASGHVGVALDVRVTLVTFYYGASCSCSSSTCHKHGMVSMQTREGKLLGRRAVRGLRGCGPEIRSFLISEVKNLLPRVSLNDAKSTGKRAILQFCLRQCERIIQKQPHLSAV